MLSKVIGTLRNRRSPGERRAEFPDMAGLGRDFPPHRRAYPYPGDFVDEVHRAIAEWPVDGVLVRGPAPGFLRKADALALYEHAYFAEGDVLEMGSAWGLSTTILGLAVRNSGRPRRVASIEIDPGFQEATRRAMEAQGLASLYEPLPGDARDRGEGLLARGRRFGFAFVDHDHAYEATRVACRQLLGLLRPGGYALFHDFNDDRHTTEPALYGIHPAVEEMVGRPGFQFLGVIGCCALVRRTL